MKIKIINFRNFIYLLFLIILLQGKSVSLENKIIYKINNEIITSLDLENEIKYLTALNPDLKTLSKNEIIKISKRSIVNEKIKKIEILKNFQNPELPLEFLEKLLESIYIKLDIKKIGDFQKYLQNNEVNYQNVLNKIETEALWNELIVFKYSKKLKIDEEKLKSRLKKNINLNTKSYLMSEIFFEVRANEKVSKKYNQIVKSIVEEGFNNAALKYSISETSRMGGKLDWIDETSLNEKIRKIVNTHNINEFTDPITLPGGFLILKINDMKITKSEKNIEQELKKLIRATKNSQLNQFSKIYFNKIKEDMEINEI